MLAFVGKSGSGKTTLAEKVIGILSGRGHRIGAIKRSHHRISVDQPGKDSYRFREAGANPTVVAGDNFYAFMESCADPVSLERLAGQFSGKADMIIIEGFKNEAVPRFMVLTGLEENLADLKDDEELIGYIMISPAKSEYHGKPVFDRDDAQGLAAWIERNYLSSGEARP